MKRLLILFITFCFASPVMLAQSFEIERIEPEFWWTGFAKTELQLLVYGEDIGKTRVHIDQPGVYLRQSIAVENPNYLFVYLDVTENASSGDFTITFRSDSKTLQHTYTLLERKGSGN